MHQDTIFKVMSAFNNAILIFISFSIREYVLVNAHFDISPMSIQILSLNNVLPANQVAEYVRVAQSVMSGMGSRHMFLICGGIKWNSGSY